MKTRAYVLHLARAVDRLPVASAIAEALPVPTRIVSAVDGMALSPSQRSHHYRERLHFPGYPFRLRAAEIGCFLTHRVAWQAILADGCDAGLIVEDDVVIAADAFERVLAASVAAIEPGDYIRFPIRARGENGAVARDLPDAQLLKPRLPGLGMQMQLVSREAARRLLEASFHFDRPVDSFVQMQWIHGARVLSARPIVVREVSAAHGGSTIQGRELSVLSKLSHEVCRPLLRLSIRIANECWRHRAAG